MLLPHKMGVKCSFLYLYFQMVTYAILKRESNTITITTEMKMQLMAMLDQLIQYVDLAIWETGTLSNNWSQIQLNLAVLHSHAVEADAKLKPNVFEDIRCVLIPQNLY